jgi:hypothetical protein
VKVRDARPDELERRCPGCGDVIPRGLFACRVDWFRLPPELRRRLRRYRTYWDRFIADTDAKERREYLAAVHEGYAILRVRS